jgi:uncharacterized protein YbjT (DUF2867 family)
LWAGEVKNGVVRAPYPDTKLPIVHPADIAASAAAVLLSPTPITGAFSITGPEKLSVCNQTAVLSDVLGTELRVEQISEDDAAKLAFPEGTPEFVTTSVLGTLGPAATALEVSGDVQLTGHAPRTFADWARTRRPSSEHRASPTDPGDRGRHRHRRPHPHLTRLRRPAPPARCR